MANEEKIVLTIQRNMTIKPENDDLCNLAEETLRRIVKDAEEKTYIENNGIHL